jgi:hypothetical protein
MTVIAHTLLLWLHLLQSFALKSSPTIKKKKSSCLACTAVEWISLKFPAINHLSPSRFPYISEKPIFRNTHDNWRVHATCTIYVSKYMLYVIWFPFTTKIEENKNQFSSCCLFIALLNSKNAYQLESLSEKKHVLWHQQ